ncbi:hypothetical protein BDV93DRAFT_526208 [Ceratobasidium sp. AG-I]|nr:hypothetical protein BDV93DRAFT_526208 [Ceratobasidium sp. AG-I]
MTLPPMHHRLSTQWPSCSTHPHAPLKVFTHGNSFQEYAHQHSRDAQRPRSMATTPSSPIQSAPRHPSRDSKSASRRTTTSEPLSSVAQNMCNMVCYLWFGRRGSPQRTSSPYSEPANVQFTPRPEFVSFIADLLATTQVSQSVITLALHYIYTLKRINPSIRGRRGSEYRLAVTALMLANKFLDDNTYTNKTWSDISRIALPEINQMEKEFLNGLNHNLYVDLATYDSWVLMLTGLIDAKERETDAYWRRQKQGQGAPHLSVPTRQQPSSHRARSSSPTFPFTFSHPVSAHASDSYPQPAPVSRQDVRPITLPPLNLSPSVMVPHRSSKRSAYDAFSPATASGTALPFKRAIPSPDSSSPGSDAGGYLASAYTADHSAAPRSDLKYLPYHTLASSPADDNQARAVRKGVLRYHELQSPDLPQSRYPILPPIRVPQSACTSPREYTYASHPEHGVHMSRHSSHAIPPPMSRHLTPPQIAIRTPPSYRSSSPQAFVYTPPRSAQAANAQPQPRPWIHSQAPRYAYVDRDTEMAELSPESETYCEFEGRPSYSPMCERVIAPFANAGPPGVHWTQVPPPMQQPVYQTPTPNWSPIRGRQL